MISHWRPFHQRGYTQVRQTSCRSTKTARDSSQREEQWHAVPLHAQNILNSARLSQGTDVWKSDYVSCLFSSGGHWEAANLLWKTRYQVVAAERGYIYTLRTQDCNIWRQSGFPGSCASFSGCREPWVLQSHTTVLSLIELRGYHCFSSQLILSFSVQSKKKSNNPFPNIHIVGFKAPLYTTTPSLPELSGSLKIGGYIKTD